jgi:DNA topoisomerase-1
MEQTLDEIATGETKWLPYVQGFFLGDAGLENQVKVRESQIDPSSAKAVILENLAAMSLIRLIYGVRLKRR